MKSALALNTLSEEGRKLFTSMDGVFPKTPFTHSHTLLVMSNRENVGKGDRTGDFFAMIPDKHASKIKSMHTFNAGAMLEHATRIVIIFDEMDAEQKHTVDLVDVDSKVFLITRKISLHPIAVARDHVVQFLIHGTTRLV